MRNNAPGKTKKVNGLSVIDVFICNIMEYGSIPYIGMAQEKNGIPIKSVQNDMFITLL